MCDTTIEAVPLPDSLQNRSSLAWVVVSFMRGALHRWRRKHLLDAVRRELDDRLLADIGLNKIPGPMDTVTTVVVDLLGGETTQEMRRRICNAPSCTPRYPLG
jgi:hypothetical protein